MGLFKLSKPQFAKSSVFKHAWNKSTCCSVIKLYLRNHGMTWCRTMHDIWLWQNRTHSQSFFLWLYLLEGNKLSKSNTIFIFNDLFGLQNQLQCVRQKTYVLASRSKLSNQIKVFLSLAINVYINQCYKSLKFGVFQPS